MSLLHTRERTKHGQSKQAVFEPASRPSSIIEIRNINRIFETGGTFTHVLKGVSLNVREGELLAIMGPSGSGKSTLMNTLGLLDRPSSGTYRLCGMDVNDLNDDERSELRGTLIGFVFQSFNLLPRTSVLRNVMLPLAYSDCPVRQREDRAVQALRSVDLNPMLFDRKTNELSGGQMQRVAIARALVRNPPIILGDEPTGNLDSKTGDVVMRTFERLRDTGKTIVIITHSPEVAARADRCLHMRDGVLREGMYQ
jgi:putative ABC transport system ATP-binding protein